MKHGQIEAPPALPIAEDEALILAGLSMHIGLYHYLRPCRCHADCVCEAGR